METVELAAPAGEGRRSWRWVVAGIGAVAVLVALAVWTMADPGEDAPELAVVEPTLAGASSATTEARSARVTLRSDPGALVLTGVMTFGPDGRGSFEVAPGADGGEDDATAGSSPQIRALPEATYLHSAGRWVRHSHEAFTLHNGIRFPPDQNPLLSIVALVIDSLDHATPGTVRDVGTDVSRGDRVTVLEAEVDIAEAIRSSAEIADEAIASDLTAAFGNTATVWLDAQGRARHVWITGGSEHVEVELWDFGVDVDVEAPDDAVDPEGHD